MGDPRIVVVAKHGSSAKSVGKKWVKRTGFA
jgi:hypothetical protein